MSKHRILVIEDQEDLAELYEAALEKAGYEVTNAYTGEEGVAEFEANGADAVFPVKYDFAFHRMGLWKRKGEIDSLR